MELGAYSLSLNVADVRRSRDFYEKLGFKVVAGDADADWLVLRNGDCTLGVFKGMIPANTLTFNPGWVSEENMLSEFTDIRTLQAQMKGAGLTLTKETEPEGTGPASIMLVDPDGNPILIDQHVDAPGAG